jgi:hypothetical protein
VNADSKELVRPSRKGTRMIRLVVSVAGGALLGWLYYRFVGCRTGACPITSNPWISAGYGALLGLLLGRG